MRWTTRLRLVLRSLVLGRRVERDLDDELRYHVETRTDDFVASGLTPLDARAAALREIGGVEQRKEECRDARGGGVMRLENLGRDVRYALRMLRRSPGFAALGVAIMALGIGANTAVFSVVYTVLLKPLPYPNPDRIVTLTNAPLPAGANTHAGSGSEAARRGDSLGLQVSAPNFWDWHDQSGTFEALALYATNRASVVAGPAAEYARVTRVSRDFLRVFGVTPAVGRGFATEDEQADGGGEVLVSTAYARERYGEVTRALGQTVRVSDRNAAVVGVLPAWFDFPDHTDIWRLTLARANAGPYRGGNNFRAVGLLKATATLTQAQSDVMAIGIRLARQYPQFDGRQSVAVTRLQDELVGDVRTMLYVLLGAVGLVLLIACANMATLLLAKATARTQEIAVRAALGATRGRILQQLLIEGLVLAIIAGVVGLGVAIWGTRALVALAPGDVPRLAEMRLDWHVLAFTFAICAIVSVLFGLPPALHASRLDVGDPLKGGATHSVVGGRGGAGGRGGRVREGLVVVEIALTLVLLAGGGLLIRSLIALQHVPLGFDPDHVLVMETTLQSRGEDGQRADHFFEALLADIAGVPGVQAVGATMGPPGEVNSDSGYVIDHLPQPLNLGDLRPAVMSVISPGTFAALGVPITRGRDFRASDTRQAPSAVIVNEALVREAFPGQDPIGRTIFCLYDTDKPLTIVGVVGNVRQYEPARPPVAECILPYTQHLYNNITLKLVVRTTIDPASLSDTLRRKARERAVDASVRFTTMDEVLDAHVAAPRFRALLLALFGVIALCLALAGVYGIMSFVVSRRANEMGLRMALGALPWDVMRLMLAGGVKLAGAGLALGLVCAIAATRLLSGLLFEVTANDIVTYIVAAGLLSIMALIAVYIPARRATRIDPLKALRQE